MNVDSFLISEFATQPGSGKHLTIVNVFNQVIGPGPQWGVPILYLTSVTHAHRDEAGRHHGEIKLVNAAREPLLREPHRFEFELTTEVVQPGMPLRHQGIYAFGGLVFNAPGPYAFELHIDGVYAAAATLYVLQRDSASDR